MFVARSAGLVGCRGWYGLRHHHRRTACLVLLLVLVLLAAQWVLWLWGRVGSASVRWVCDVTAVVYLVSRLFIRAHINRVVKGYEIALQVALNVQQFCSAYWSSLQSKYAPNQFHT